MSIENLRTKLSLGFGAKNSSKNSLKNKLKNNLKSSLKKIGENKVKRLLSSEIGVVFVVLFTFFTVFTTVSLHRYWQYSAWYYDFGIFYTAISAVAQLKPPIIDHFVFTDQNILGDHFHPIIFLISPFVALYPGGETLLIMQVLFVTLSGIFMYLTAKEILKNKFEAFSFLVIYCSFIGLHNALITEFHEIVLLPLPLSIFFYGMVKKKLNWYSLGFLGILLTKETLFVIPAWFGLLLALKNWKIRSKRLDRFTQAILKNDESKVERSDEKRYVKDQIWKKIGIATIITSVLYGLLVMFVIIPTINGSGYYYLSDTIARKNELFFLDELTLKSIIKTILSFGLLPIFSPELLVPVLFNWWMRISRFGNFDLGMHYNAEIAPTLLLATIFGWQRLKQFFNKRWSQILFTPNVLFGLALCTLFFSLQILKSPALLFTNKAFYQNTQNHEFLNRLIENIPKDGVVMAQTNIAAKLGYRKVYMLRENYLYFKPDYIVFDMREGQEPNNFLNIEDPVELFATIESDPEYELLYGEGDQRIYKRR